MQGWSKVIDKKVCCDFRLSLLIVSFYKQSSRDENLSERFKISPQRGGLLL